MKSLNFRTDSFAKKYFFLLMGIAIVCWACAFPVIQIGLRELTPINLTIMRLFLVSLIFLLFILIAPKKFSKLHKKDILPIFLLGFFGVTVYHLGLNYGEQYISASAASLIIATSPIFVVIIAAVFLKEKITKKIILGILLSLAGVLIISVAGIPNNAVEITYMTAAVAVFIAALMSAYYTTTGKKLLARYSALSLTVYAIVLGSLGLLPFISTSLFDQVSSLSLSGWSAVFFLALFPTVIGYVLWYVALEQKSASEVSVYLYFIPVLSTIISFFLFQTPITLFFILGGALVILGLVIVNKKNNTVVQEQ